MSALQEKQQQLRVGSARSPGCRDGTGAPRSPSFSSFHRRYLGAGGPGGAMAASEQRWGGRAGAPCPLPQAEQGAGLRGRGAPGGRFLPSSRARAGGGDRAGRIPGRRQRGPAAAGPGGRSAVRGRGYPGAGGLTGGGGGGEGDPGTPGPAGGRSHPLPAPPPPPPPPPGRRCPIPAPLPAPESGRAGQGSRGGKFPGRSL